jgi:hypothetical protein
MLSRSTGVHPSTKLCSTNQTIDREREPCSGVALLMLYRAIQLYMGLIPFWT